MIRISGKQMELVEATPELLHHALAGNKALSRHLGAEVPLHWTEFAPRSLEYTLTQLGKGPEQTGWWTYFPIWLPDQILVGSCGFKGPPDATGIVEIGYETAVTYRGRGMASRMARLLTQDAWSDERVRTIQAHTLAKENPSTAILRRLGFQQTTVLVGSDRGDIWRWTIKKPLISKS